VSSGRLVFHWTLVLLFLFASESLGAQELTPPVPSDVPKPIQTIVLKEGTEVNLKFAQKLTAKGAVVDQPVELALAEDLKVLDYIVIKRGARVLGTIIAGKESEKKKEEAKALAIRVDFLHSGDYRIALRGDKIAEGKRNKDAMVAGTILLGISGLIMTSGKHYVIPEGTPLTAYVDQDIELPVLQN
jgi:predicted DNA-binding antitoxin AbrB/MazE fold protein